MARKKKEEPTPDSKDPWGVFRSASFEESGFSRSGLIDEHPWCKKFTDSDGNNVWHIAAKYFPFDDGFARNLVYDTKTSPFAKNAFGKSAFELAADLSSSEVISQALRWTSNDYSGRREMADTGGLIGILSSSDYNSAFKNRVLGQFSGKGKDPNVKGTLAKLAENISEQRHFNQYPHEGFGEFLKTMIKLGDDPTKLFAIRHPTWESANAKLTEFFSLFQSEHLAARVPKAKKT